MKRTVKILAPLGLASVILAGLPVIMSGCSNASSEASTDELGVQQGRRPVPESKRKPPGPPDGKVVTEEEASNQDSDEEETEDDG